MSKKSKCHQERRNSPSVATFRPTSACFLMIFSISRSSTSLRAAALISLFSRFARASFKGAVRKRLPTTSARNGGVVLVIGKRLLTNFGGKQAVAGHFVNRKHARLDEMGVVP